MAPATSRPTNPGNLPGSTITRPLSTMPGVATPTASRGPRAWTSRTASPSRGTTPTPPKTPPRLDVADRVDEQVDHRRPVQPGRDPGRQLLDLPVGDHADFHPGASDVEGGYAGHASASARSRASKRARRIRRDVAAST